MNYDYDHELSLEMKRQKIQRELMKLEEENMEKREEIVIKKEVHLLKTHSQYKLRRNNRAEFKDASNVHVSFGYLLHTGHGRILSVIHACILSVFEGFFLPILKLEQFSFLPFHLFSHLFSTCASCV